MVCVSCLFCSVCQVSRLTWFTRYDQVKTRPGEQVFTVEAGMETREEMEVDPREEHPVETDPPQGNGVAHERKGESIFSMSRTVYSEKQKLWWHC